MKEAVFSLLFTAVFLLLFHPERIFSTINKVSPSWTQTTTVPMKGFHLGAKSQEGYVALPLKSAFNPNPSLSKCIQLHTFKEKYSTFKA